MLFKGDLERIQEDLAGYDSAREKLLAVSRNATRLAGRAMLQVHKMQLREAEETLKRIEETISEMEKGVNAFPELSHHAQALVAYQEYVEAKALYTLSTEGRLCTLEEVKVPSNQYLLGLLDLVGELRRLSLECLKRGDPESAEDKMNVMEEIYESLMSLEHTSMIQNFRRKMDTARRLIEATRGDVVTGLRRWSLEKAINGLSLSMSRRGRGGRDGVDVLNREGQESSANDG